MNLRETLLAEHSKTQTDAIATWVGMDETRLECLMDLFMNDTYRVVQRAAWVISNIAVKHPQMIRKYLATLVEKLDDNAAHIAVKRNIFRIFDHIDIPDPLHGAIMDRCFNALENPAEALAVRAFAIGILMKLMQFYPEIKHEFKIILEDYLRHETAPSFRSRAAKALKKMGAIKRGY